MRLLAIETSCDETGIAIIEARDFSSGIKKINVLSNVLISQAQIHSQFGGVFPSLARREHAKNIIPLILHAFGEAGIVKKLKTPRTLTKNEDEKLSKILQKEPGVYKDIIEKLLSVSIPKIDGIAVTSGPGLEPALWVGINTAEALSFLWDAPTIPVNHMEGHIVTALLHERPVTEKEKLTNYNLQQIQYPALALLISGGHTELVLIPTAGKYKMLGQTRDDAVGEAFDKVARMLGLAYPGGPEISRLAEKAPQGEKLSLSLPRPMLKSDDFDFSFSGLKTSVLYAIKKFETLTERDKELIAKDFEDSVTEVLLAKTLRAAKKYKVKEIILGGGVSANKKIRGAFTEGVAKELPGVNLFIPEVHHSGDNGLMIGVAGILRAKSKKHITANGNLRLAKSVTPTLAELRRKNMKK